MKILSSFSHPPVVPNLYECLCSAEHKGRYSEECGKQSSSGAPLTSIVFFSYYGSQWCPKTTWLQTFFKISFFVFGRTKKLIQVWNYLRMRKWWQNFHFWVNYPFKCKFTEPLYKSEWYTLLSLLIFSTYALSIKREGRNLTKKKKKEISRLHSSAVMLVNSAVLRYCGYCDNPTLTQSFAQSTHSRYKWSDR